MPVLRLSVERVVAWDMKNLLLGGLLAVSLGARAQTSPPPTYEFLTLEAVESANDKLSKITFSPSFQGKTQLPLEELSASFDKTALAHQHNLVTVNQQLEALTAAGWELVQVATSTVLAINGRDYLFRRRKP